MSFYSLLSHLGRAWDTSRLNLEERNMDKIFGKFKRQKRKLKTQGDMVPNSQLI